MKKIIIWDLDGTLFDTIGDLTAAVNYGLANNGLKPKTIAEVTSYIGNGIRNLIERSSGNCDKEIVDKVFADFKAYYKDHCIDSTYPYAGIKELVTELKAKGYKQAIVSNKANSLTNKIVDNNLPGIFDLVYGELEGMPRKPDPALINLVLNQTGTSNKEAIYIGDSEVDIKTAQNVAMDLIAVSYGYRDKEKLALAKANCIVDNIEELREEICRFK